LRARTAQTLPNLPENGVRGAQAHPHRGQVPVCERPAPSRLPAEDAEEFLDALLGSRAVGAGTHAPQIAESLSPKGARCPLEFFLARSVLHGALVHDGDELLELQGDGANQLRSSHILL